MLVPRKKYRVVKEIPKVVLTFDPTKAIILYGKRPQVGEIVILEDVYRQLEYNTYVFSSKNGKFWIEAITDAAVLQFLEEC